MKAALYLRVSTDEQSVDSQRADLLAECQRRGWEPVEYVDAGFSGAKKDRPALERLQADIRARKIGAVLCYKLDRLGRSLAHLVQLFEYFELKGCAFVVPGQGIDTSKSNPAADLQRNILGAVCQFERSMIRERVMAGLAVAKARGHLKGRRPRGLGKGAESKRRRAAAIVAQDPDISVRDLARELEVSIGTAWKLRKVEL